MGKKIQCIGRYAMEGHTLGKGNFARVELARHTVTGVKVAIKIIDRSRLKEDYQKDHLTREARIMGQLRHPNIVRLYETLKATTLHCLVLELAAGGELQTFIRCHKDCRLPEDKARPFVRQLVSALHYIHERGVAHRDLKMENIMLDEKRKHVKLVDFGLSVTFTKGELMKTHCGSPEYAAPELFAAEEKYGPEIDVWSLGIVMYAMLIGHLPFTTPYTDHYRRQKLVQQMEKGLTDCHSRDMAILSQDCQDLFRKVIEPSPQRRLPLLEMEVHPWITNNAKLPFFPFQAFPRDKAMRSQGSPSLRQQSLQDSVCSTDEDETLVELSQKLEVKREHVEQKVGEGKSDEMSAMYNMMLDTKRREQGLYDVDHTAKPMERREGKTKRRAKSAPGDKKGKGKLGAPPSLVLPTAEVSVESAPHSGDTTEPENRMTSFDFLALCSTPTWLGPERRRSRRRGRSPNLSTQPKNTEGLSVRSKLRRDYMERHGIEASHAVLSRDEHHASTHGHHHHHHSNHQHHPSHGPSLTPSASNFLSPDQATSKLCVPDSDGTNPSHRRGSVKFSRQRARSFGPGLKKRLSFQRSGSVDTPMQNRKRLQSAKSETLTTNSPTAISVAAASLAVAFGGQTPNLLTLHVPGLKPNLAPRPANLTLKECYPVNGEKTLKTSSHNSARLVKDSLVPLVAEKVVMAARGPLTSVEVHVSDSVTPHLPVPNLVLQANPQNVSGGLQVPVTRDKLQLPSNVDLPNAIGGCWSTESLFGDSEMNLLPSPDLPDHAQNAVAGSGQHVRPLDLLDCSKRPVFHQQVPPHALSLPVQRPSGQREGEQGAIAMQLGLPKASVLSGAIYSCRPDSRDVIDTVRKRGNIIRARNSIDEGQSGLCSELEPNLQALTFDGIAGATGISGNFNDDDEEEEEEEEEMENEAEVTMEDEEVVFTGDSDHIHQYLSALPKGRAVGGAVSSILHHGLPSPDELEEDLLLMGRGSASASVSGKAAVLESLRGNKCGSTGSHSQASSSGGRSQKRGSVSLQGGKLKTPSTPLSWMILRSPLARIESFHSDDFEYYNSSDNEPAEHASGTSASPLSASTPTVPCFAYKLNMARKKPPKLKKGIGDNHIRHKTSKHFSAAAAASVDKGKSSSGATIIDPAATDPLLLSSGSDTEHLDDAGDRTGVASKAKIHPGDKDHDKMLLKTENKVSAQYNNAITQQPNRQAQQNSVKLSKNLPTLALEPKKKSVSKNSPWKRSFAQFLKRKRQSSRCTSNNNNNECASTPMLPANHNGCSPSSPVSKVESHQVQVAVINNTSDFSWDLAADTGNCKAPGYIPTTENNIAEVAETQTQTNSLPASPDPGVGARVFDFTLLTDSPKGRPCLLSWRPCGDCATSDLSSEDENECNREPVTTFDLKPLGNNSIPDGSHTYLTSHECSQT